MVVETAGPQSMEQRVTLFACALRKNDAVSLMAGFREEVREGAELYARNVLALDTSSRHGRMHRAFGVRADGLARVQRQLGELSPSLRDRVQTMMDAPASMFASRTPRSGLADRMASRILREGMR